MSEYQRYEFMTSDRTLTRARLDEARRLSSHIEATASQAVIEYHWGDFKHDPLNVLYTYFDGFLYWANWGAPQFAFRFPHGVLPANLLVGYDIGDYDSLTPHPDFDILGFQFAEMEGPDEWTEYDLGSLMPLRDELMDGDRRPLYIAWLAAQRMMRGYSHYDGSGDEEEAEDDDEVVDLATPSTPPGLGALTAAQQELARLLQVPHEQLVAAARHSALAAPVASSVRDDFAAWVQSLSPSRRDEYIVRLANNEPGLSHLLVRELRALRPDASSGDSQADANAGEYVSFATLHAESKAIKAQQESERREQERQERLRHLQQVHDHQDDYWRRITEAVERDSGPGYDEATTQLVELRQVTDHFGKAQQFQERFRAWVQPHLRRPAFHKRLIAQGFTLPEALA